MALYEFVFRAVFISFCLLLVALGVLLGQPRIDVLLTSMCVMLIVSTVGWMIFSNWFFIPKQLDSTRIVLEKRPRRYVAKMFIEGQLHIVPGDTPSEALLALVRTLDSKRIVTIHGEEVTS